MARALRSTIDLLNKLFIAALALAVARRWPAAISNPVDPGRVRDPDGRPSPTEDLEPGRLTQTWLAGSDAPRPSGMGQVLARSPCSNPARWRPGQGGDSPAWAASQVRREGGQVVGVRLATLDWRSAQWREDDDVV